MIKTQQYYYKQAGKGGAVVAQDYIKKQDDNLVIKNVINFLILIRENHRKN